MKRLLIVAPHFAPISAPDGQRARTLAPHLPDFGWEPHILTVDPSAAESPLEPDLLRTLPDDLPVTRVSAISARLARRVGLGNIAWRAWLSLRRAGDRLLREQRFDLVYFSTTQFACLPLGRIWQRRHGIPFVIDLQDPWRNDFTLPPGVRPPGGWKYLFAATQARWLEPWTLRRCAGIVSVSPAYLDQLVRRYAWWNPSLGQTIPMGWSAHDFATASRSSTSPAVESGVIRYLGRLGPDMGSALDVFLTGLAAARRADSSASLLCEFRGGSYDPRAVAGPAQTAAQRRGVSAAVSEDPTRIPYLAALAALRTAGANLILGSDDSGYAPSKVWLTLAAGRPWLALARRGTVLHGLLEPHVNSTGWLVDPCDSEAPARVARCCRLVPEFPRSLPEPLAIAEFEARELARQHADFFRRVAPAG